MSSVMRRIISPGPASAEPNSNQNYNFQVPNGSGGFRYPNREAILQSNTKWVKFWVSWDRLQPYSATANPATDTTPYASGPNWYSYFGNPHPAAYVAQLDQQINDAKAAGLHVMLIFWRFARWANGTSGAGPWPREPELHPPDDVSVTSPWGRMLEWILLRWRTQAEFVAIMNEPNGQWWPQRSSGYLVTDCKASDMFHTADAIMGAYYPNIPRLMGPETSDWDGSSNTDYDTRWDTWTDAFLARLEATSFQEWHMWAYTHHNYTDTEKDNGSGSHVAANVNRNYTRDVRQKLVNYGWAGWPNQDWTDPRLCVTEGSCRLEKVRQYYGTGGPYVSSNPGGTPLTTQDQWEAKQASLMQRMGNRMYLGAESAGISFICNYLTYGVAGSDSGLMNPPGSGRPERRPSWNTWTGLPSY